MGTDFRKETEAGTEGATEMNQLVLTAEQVAEILQVSPKTIRDDAEKRWPNFPRAIRIGRLKRWRPQDIQDWINRRA